MILKHFAKVLLLPRLLSFTNCIQILGWVVKFFLLLVSSRLVRMTLDMQWSLLEKQTLAWTNLFSNFDHLLLTRRKILAWMMTAKGGVVDWFPFLSSLDTKWSLLEKQTLAWITLFSIICYSMHLLKSWSMQPTSSPSGKFHDFSF